MTPNLEEVQRRTLRVLFVSQIAGGVGIVIGGSVGALLAADMVSVGVSGLAQSATVMGGALLALPAARIVQRYGRGPSLSTVYMVAALGAFLSVAAAMTRSVPLLFVGFFLFGGGSAASLQARYAAVDLAPKALYGRHLSMIVWATTLGGVVGPTLAPVAGTTLSPYGVPPLAAPFVFSVVLFVVVAIILFLSLRPDPLLLARRMNAAQTESATTPKPYAGLGVALRTIIAHPAARLGVTSTAVGHIVMVAVMSMTPVHILGAGHGAAHTLRIVGIVISVHVAGMYAFSPVMGWLSDRVGKTRVILLGVGLFLAACAVAGTAGHDGTRLGIGLFLLGLGWSATMVAGSTLLSESISIELRPSAQGLSDLLMGLAGASSGALSGVVVQSFSFPMLTTIAAILTVPLAALVVSSKQLGATVRIISLTAILLTALAVEASSQDTAAYQIRRLDSLWARMYARQDTALALQLYAEDLAFTSADGTRKNRSQELADVRPQPGFTMDFFRTTPLDVRMTDSTASVAGIAEWRFLSNGQPRQIRRSYVTGYARGGPLGWRIRTVRMGRALPTTRFAVSSDGTRIGYDVAGTGPALMLLHGGGQTRNVWHDNGYVMRLVKDFTVITVDMRGSGSSDKPTAVAAYAIDKLQADLLAVADSAGARRFAIWGFSYGANIGRYLARSSDRVTSMVYVGIPFGAAADGVFRQTIERTRAKWMPVIEQHQRGTLDLASLSEDDRNAWNRASVPLLVAWLTAMLDYPVVEPADMAVPTLWLVGTANQGAMASVNKYRDALARTRVTLSLLEGLAHPQELQSIDQVLPVVTTFLSRHR